jgi:hypothetical protein
MFCAHRGEGGDLRNLVFGAHPDEGRRNPPQDKCVVETVQRFGGFVAKYMGDGVLVYFGAGGPTQLQIK